jgi:hypothetical protein
MQSNRTTSQPADEELFDHGSSSLDTSPPVSRDYDKPADGSPGHSLFSERELEPISTPDIGAVDHPVFGPVHDERRKEETQANVDLEYSPSQGEPPWWEATDPFGLNKFDQEFSEPDEPLVDSVETGSAFFRDQTQSSVGEFDSDHDIPILDFSVNSGMAEEMRGSTWFEEIPDDQVSRSDVSTDESNPLFPDSEDMFSGEFEEDDWLSF